MKSTILTISILLVASVANAGVSLKTEPAKVLGLWAFTESITETGKRNSTLVSDLFKKSRFSSDARIQGLLERFKKVRQNQFSRSYAFAGYPSSRPEMSWDISRHFDFQASQSKTLKEFRSRTNLLMAPAEHSELFNVLAGLEPVYDEILWKKYSARLPAYAAKLESTWKKGKLSDLYAKMTRFYRSSGDVSDFVIHMMPIPGKGHSTATVIDSAVILEALVDEKDIAGRVGVIFHELCHAAFHAQSNGTQAELESWFGKNTSQFTPFAQKLFDEGLATALGNGLAFKEITGKEDESSWYSVEEIDQGAKANTDLVRSYVSNGKSIDQSFVNQWIANYENRFPSALKKYDIRLREIVLLTDGEVMKSPAARTELRRAFRVQSVFSGSPIGTDESVKTVEEAGPLASLVLVVSAAQLKQVSQLSKKVPGLAKGLAALEASGSSRLVSYSSDGRIFVLFRVESQAELKTLVEKLKSIKEVPDQPAAVAEV